MVKNLQVVVTATSATDGNTLQNTATHCKILQHTATHMVHSLEDRGNTGAQLAGGRDDKKRLLFLNSCILHCVAVCCSVMQCVAVCCS